MKIKLVRNLILTCHLVLLLYNNLMFFLFSNHRKLETTTFSCQLFSMKFYLFTFSGLPSISCIRTTQYMLPHKPLVYLGWVSKPSPSYSIASAFILILQVYIFFIKLAYQLNMQGVTIDIDISKQGRP